jgi:hypothetical protein
MVVRMSAPNIQFEEVDPATPAATAAVQRYLAEPSRRFATGFDPAYAISSAVADQQQRFLLATRTGRRSAACAPTVGRRVAEIMRMWVDPGARASFSAGGSGRAGGPDGPNRCQVIQLGTNGSLTDAIGLYERQGYRRIPRYRDNPYAQVWFEKVLV